MADGYDGPNKIPGIGHNAASGRRHGSWTPNYEILIRLANERAKVELGISDMFTMVGGKMVLSPGWGTAVGSAIKVNVAAMVTDVVEKSVANGIDALEVLAAVIAEESEDSSHLRQANRTLAVLMHRGMLASYSSKIKQRRQVPPYRRRNRLSGHLESALRNPSMVTGDATGIHYIDQDRLDVEARHWRRINFGVEPAQTPKPQTFKLLGDANRRYNVKSRMRSTGEIGFPPQPRPPMFLPPGFWLFIGGRINKAGEDVGTNFRRRRTSRLEFTETTSVMAKRKAAREARVAQSMAQKTGRPASAAEASSDPSFKVESRTITPYRDRYFSKRRNYGPQYRRSGALAKHGPGHMPGGIRRSQQAFYPSKRTGKKIPTKGIVGANFLDGGFRALRDNVDKVYFGMAQEILHDASPAAANKKAQKVLARYKPNFEKNILFSEGRRSVIDRAWLLNIIEQSTIQRTDTGRIVYREGRADSGDSGED